MLPSPLASLSCFHYLADKQSKNARSTTEKPVRHGRTAGVCLTKRERPESRNARPRESSLKTLHDENGQGMRQPVRSSGRQAKTRKRTDTSFRPERELQRLRAVRRGYSVAGRTGRRSRRRLREGPRPVGRRNGLGATDSLSRMRVAGRAFGSGRNPSETFRRLSARRPRRIGERLSRQHPSVFPVQPVRNVVPFAHSARPTENGFNFTPEMHGNPQKDCSAFSCDQTFRFVAAFRTHGQKHPDAVKNRQRPRPDIVLSEIPIILHLRPSVAGPATGESPTRFRTAPRRIPVSELPFRRERATASGKSSRQTKYGEERPRDTAPRAPAVTSYGRNDDGPAHAATRCCRGISSASWPRGRAESHVASDEANRGDGESPCERGIPA